MEDKKAVEALIPIDSLRLTLIFIFNNYYYQRKEFMLYSFYDYIKLISDIKYNIK